MIFGKTKQEKAESRKRYRFNVCRGVKFFAILPTRLHDGRWAWFETVWGYGVAHVTMMNYIEEIEDLAFFTEEQEEFCMTKFPYRESRSVSIQKLCDEYEPKTPQKR